MDPVVELQREQTQAMRDLFTRLDNTRSEPQAAIRDVAVGQRWIVGLLFTSWVTTIGLIMCKTSD